MEGAIARMPTVADWYHAHVEPVGRAEGRTVSGVAAYVTGERIKDEEPCTWKKRNHPGDVEEWGLTAPNGASPWFIDKKNLADICNEIERSETRSNSDLARHWNYAMSREFSHQDRVWVANQIAQ